MALSEDQLNAAIDRLVDAFDSATGRVSGASSTAATGLSRMATNSKFVQTAFQGLTGSAATLRNVQNQQYMQGQNLVKNILLLSQASIKATEALYSMAPGLGGYLRTFDESVGALNKMMDSAALAGVLTLNPALAGAGAALKIFGTVMNATAIPAARMLVQMMDREITAYRQSSEVGATFAGSLGVMQIAARSAGVGVELLSKIARDSAESISKTGLSMSMGATVVAQYAKTLTRTDRGLVSLYGTTEELAKSTADYLALQSQIGKTDLNNQGANTKGLKEYLRTQKELSDITGKRASQIKAEEEARRKELAYSLKLSRLGDVARQNVEEGMAVATRMFGPEGAKYAQEYFATGGQVISKESLRFAAMMPDVANAIGQMVNGVDESKDEYRKRIGEYLGANKEALFQSAKQMEQFAEINYGANNPIFTALTAVGSSILASSNLINDYNNLLKKATDERENLDKGKIVVQIGKGDYKEIIDPSLELIKTIEIQRLDNQLKIDAIVKRNMGDMQGLIEGLGKVQDLQIKITGLFADATGTITKSITDAIKGLSPTRENPANPPRSSELPTVDVGTVPTGGRAVPVVVTNPQNRTANPPTPGPAENPPNQSTRATGGIATGPTTVGEDGPEAVIPLAKGAVPMNIDWRPLIAAMDNQSTLTENLIRAVNDSKDIQQRMLHSMG